MRIRASTAARLFRESSSPSCLTHPGTALGSGAFSWARASPAARHRAVNKAVADLVIILFPSCTRGRGTASEGVTLPPEAAAGNATGPASVGVTHRNDLW